LIGEVLGHYVCSSTGTIVMVKLTKRMEKMLTLIYALTLHGRTISAKIVRRVGRGVILQIFKDGEIPFFISHFEERRQGCI
jgi:hypothetical protein